jgi:hypothetical protein
MTGRMAKILAAAIAFGFGLETSFAPGIMPGMPGVMSEAFAFGHGGTGGGGHFGGFGGGRRSLAPGSSQRKPATPACTSPVSAASSGASSSR